MSLPTADQLKPISKVLAEGEKVDLHELRASVRFGLIPENMDDRAAMWQLLLGYVPEDRSARVSALKEKRRRYREAVGEVDRHPIESAPEDDHPLSLRGDSHWAKFFSVKESERLIVLDVERTHPNVPAFRDLRESMRRILLAFWMQHPSVGYRQGMNELLAPFLYVFSSATKSTLEDAEADAYNCLCIVMEEMADLYKPGTPVLSREFDMINELLKLRDPELFRHLNDLSIDARLYGTRWLRLWLTQEFKLSDTLILWDSILTATPRVPWLRCICASMVLAVRRTLLSSDFNAGAQVLFRYASNNVHVRLILDLAEALRGGKDIRRYLS